MTSPLPLTIGTSSPSVNPTGPAVPDTTPVKETNRNVNKELGSKGDNKKDMADEIDERSVEVGYSEFIKKFCEHTNELSNVKFKEIQAATRGFFQNLKHIVDNTKESETYSILVRRFSSFPSRILTAIPASGIRLHHLHTQTSSSLYTCGSRRLCQKQRVRLRQTTPNPLRFCTSYRTNVERTTWI